MAKEISIPKMYASEEIPCMLFDCPEDADEFDAQFVPYVYKSLLAYYKVTFLDYCIPGKERRWTFTYPQKE